MLFEYFESNRRRRQGRQRQKNSYAKVHETLALEMEQLSATIIVQQLIHLTAESGLRLQEQ